MSRIRDIEAPLPGERVVALSPEDETAAAATWLRRPNLFPGRALTAPTLEGRVRWAAGRIAQRGQAFTAGVVRGLEAGWIIGEPEEEGGRPRVSLRISAGRGLATSGEDVVLAREVEADLWGLPVVAPPGVFQGDGFGGGGVLQPREVGPPLGEVLDELPGALPGAGVLVLQPVQVERADVDPDDPCDRCGCDDNPVSFEDWRWADGARLLWYCWPEDWRPLPPAGPRRRNLLAWSVFDAEAGLGADHVLPWEELGVPVALVGMDAEFLPVFTDRAAVVRQGGRGRHPRLELAASEGGVRLTASTRAPTLWQARVEQLAAQVAEAGDPSPAPEELAAAFERLPPFGLLPRSVVDLGSGSSAFFPASFDLDAVPVPVEQLDLALRESAGMASLEMAAGERVRLLVPVSQASWEPRLLQTEVIDPEFHATLDRFLVDRTRALAARRSIRVKSSVLLRALQGEAPPIPTLAEDPGALEPESLEGWTPPGAEGGHRIPSGRGVRGHGFEGATETLDPREGETFYTWAYLDPDRPPRTLMLEWRSGRAEHRAYWGENLIDLGTDGRVTRLRMGDLPEAGSWVRLEVSAAAMEYEDSAVDGMVFRLYDGQAAFGPSGLIGQEGAVPWFDGALPDGAEVSEAGAFTFLTANELLAPLEPRSGVVPADENLEVPEGVSGSLQELAEDERLTGLLSSSEQSQLQDRGVEGFIAYLRARADRADDLVDYGFLKVQTDVYRVRQLVLGTTDATRLAVSPTLAGIAKAETAVASQEAISSFFDRLRGQDPGEAGGGAATGAAGGNEPAPIIVDDEGEGEGGGLTGALFLGGTTFVRGMSSGGLPLADFSSGGGGGDATGIAGVSGGGQIEGISGRRGDIAFGGSILEGAIDAGVLRNVDFSRDVQISVRDQPGVADLVEAQTKAGIFSKGTSYTPVDVTNATPLVGKFDIRTLSVAERLQLPKAQEARDYSTSTRHEAVLGLVRLADTLTAEDGEVPGLFDDIDVWGLQGDEFLPDPGEGDPVASLRRPLSAFISMETRASLLPSLLRPPLRQQADEAQYFSDSADLADRTVALLRQVEGRVKRYREAIQACERVVGELRGGVKALGARERAWGETLAEARHDVSVTRALIAEEEARLAAINARRAEILEREVRFVAYARPRATDNLAPAASRTLRPGLLEAPVPACLRDPGGLPPELRETLKVVREAPADWFRVRTPLLDRLDRVDLLVEAVRTTQLRARLARDEAPFQVAAASGPRAAIGKVHLLQRQRVAPSRSRSLELDLSSLARASWSSVRAEAAKVVSLGDLADGRHGQGAVAQGAAAFFERFSTVCGCLHEEFSRVLPAIRLDWAEILSEFDEAPSLRNLGGLPRWGDIGYEERRRLQALTDWLFDQVDPRETRAVGLVNDVVRMSILLASHAPVGRIVAGRLPRPVTARPGERIPLLALDPSRLRIGMEALVYRAGAIVARGVVEDLGAGEAAARVTYTTQASVELDETARVHFAPMGSASLGFLGPGSS